MATRAYPSRRLITSFVSLTPTQRALWQLGTPIVDADTVAEYKKRARLGMLWRVVRAPILALALLVTFECLGGLRGRAVIVAAAALALGTLFAWLVYASDLQWRSMSYVRYRGLHEVPPHVSAVADALLDHGVAEQQVRVEYLKNDPILFVGDDKPSCHERYDLIVW